MRTKRLVGGFHSARLVAILCVMQPGSQGRGILAGIATGFRLSDQCVRMVFVYVWFDNCVKISVSNKFLLFF